MKLTIFLSFLLTFIFQLNNASAVRYRHVNTIENTFQHAYITINGIYPIAAEMKSIYDLKMETGEFEADLKNIQSDYENKIDKVSLSSDKFGFGIGLGYKTNSPLRYELMLEFYQIKRDLDSLYTSGYLAESGTVYAGIQLNNRNYNLLINTYWDFDHSFKSITPFVGIGLGVTNLTGFIRSYNTLYSSATADSLLGGVIRTNSSYINLHPLVQILFGTNINFSKSISTNISFKQYFIPDATVYNSRAISVGGMFKIGLEK